MNRVVTLYLLVCAIGCAAPRERLTFPASPLRQSGNYVWYDTHHDGGPDFALALDDKGDVDSVCYADHRDGHVNRVYRLGDYADRDVPHVIILLDSIPYQSLVDFYKAGHLRFFHEPQKVIAPFPSLTEICYSDVLHAPPLPGMIDQSYDPRVNRERKAFWERVRGYNEPWERRLDYHSKFFEQAFAYIRPRPWYGAELKRCHATIDKSANRVTIVYTTSASGMVCKYGRQGVEEVLIGAEQLCLQLLHEHHGAVKLSLMADHGHNLMHSTNVHVADWLKQEGLNPTGSLNQDKDVLLEISGLVTYAGIQTTEPRRVAGLLLKHPEIELVTYVEGDRVMVRDAKSIAAIECKSGRVRYVPLEGDVLNYRGLVSQLIAAHKADADGFADDKAWLSATANDLWPDLPRRIWDAFHRTAVVPPRVMFTLKDGYCCGLKHFESMIDMASTHGGLNQINSATFVMTMCGERAVGPMRSRDVLNWLEPGFEPVVHAK